MTKDEAKAYRRRWVLLEAHLTEELRQTPRETKLRQLATLMASVDSFGWREKLNGEVEQVRSRWQRLRQAYGQGE